MIFPCNGSYMVLRYERHQRMIDAKTFSISFCFLLLNLSSLLSSLPAFHSTTMEWAHTKQSYKSVRVLRQLYFPASATADHLLSWAAPITRHGCKDKYSGISSTGGYSSPQTQG